MTRTFTGDVLRIIRPGYPTSLREIRHRLTNLILAETARHIPERIRFYVLINEGVRNMRSNEIVPEVPFTVILERFGKPQKEWRS